MSALHGPQMLPLLLKPRGLDDHLEPPRNAVVYTASALTSLVSGRWLRGDRRASFTPGVLVVPPERCARARFVAFRERTGAVPAPCAEGRPRRSQCAAGARRRGRDRSHCARLLRELLRPPVSVSADRCCAQLVCRSPTCSAARQSARMAGLEPRSCTTDSETLPGTRGGSWYRRWGPRCSRPRFVTSRRTTG
jgi:hypothetical protein